MTVELMRDLTAALRTVSDADDVRVVTLLGEGSVFCAGMDLEMMRDRVEADSDVERDVFPDLLAAVESARQPVVAGIRRAAPAGAFELTLPCDLRVLGREATYGVIEVRLGTFPHGGATQRLPRLVGLSKAKELVLTGEFVDPQRRWTAGWSTRSATTTPSTSGRRPSPTGSRRTRRWGSGTRNGRSTRRSKRRSRRGWNSSVRWAGNSTTPVTTGRGSTLTSRTESRSSAGRDAIDEAAPVTRPRRRRPPSTRFRRPARRRERRSRRPAGRPRRRAPASRRHRRPRSRRTACRRR